MKGAESLEDVPDGLDREVRADDSDNVAGGFDLFGQLHQVGRHGAAFQSAK